MTARHYCHCRLSYVTCYVYGENYGENVVWYLYMNELSYGGCQFYWAHTGPSGHGQLRSDLDRRHYFSQRSVHRVLHHRNPAENRELASTRRLWIHYSLTVMLLKKTTNVLEEENWHRDMVLPWNRAWESRMIRRHIKSMETFHRCSEGQI